MTQLSRFFYAIALTICFSMNVQADIYYYQDSEGVVRFSDEPPAVGSYHVYNENIEKKFRRALKKYPKEKLRKLIAQLSKKYGIDPALVEAIVKAESEYDAMAISPKGAKGLMQLMPVTAKSLGVNDAHNPEENLDGGIQYFKKLMDHYKGNLDLALAAYNAGQKSVEKYNGIPPYTETIDYIAKVRKYYSRFAENENRSSNAFLNGQKLMAP